MNKRFKKKDIKKKLSRLSFKIKMIQLGEAFSFGKYEGISLANVIDIDYKYVEW